jgi:hypothetical protein
MVKFLSSLLLVALIGCSSTQKMNNISLGMSKAEVIAVMGSPNSSAGYDGGVEVLKYSLAKNLDEVMLYTASEYFIQLKDGKVTKYGRMGDFDSTKDPTTNVNLNVKHE